MKRIYLAPLLVAGGVSAWAALGIPSAARMVDLASSEHATLRTWECTYARQTPSPSQALQESLFPRRRRAVLTGESYDEVLQLTPTGSVGPVLTACTFNRFSTAVSARTLKDCQSFLGIRRE